MTKKILKFAKKERTPNMSQRKTNLHQRNYFFIKLVGKVVFTFTDFLKEKSFWETHLQQQQKKKKKILTAKKQYLTFQHTVTLKATIKRIQWPPRKRWKEIRQISKKTNSRNYLQMTVSQERCFYVCQAF